MSHSLQHGSRCCSMQLHVSGCAAGEDWITSAENGCKVQQAECTYPQGMFIKRHKIEKGDGNGPLKPADFAIGAAIKMYGRVMIVVDADPFTRRHMASLGIELGPALSYPADPAEEYRAAFARKTTGAHRPAAVILTPESRIMWLGCEWHSSRCRMCVHSCRPRRPRVEHRRCSGAVC